MKRFALLIIALLLTLGSMAQKQADFTDNDVKQFYNTLQGDYSIAVNDSTLVEVHITPIWENQRFRWLYLEAVQGEQVILQKVLEVEPKSDKVFKVGIHSLKRPGQFAGKWSNRNFFDGFTSSILSGNHKLTFFKTDDFSYQTNWNRINALECFPYGDLLHFKFVQADEMLYVKRMPANSTRIIGFQGLKELGEGTAD